MKSIIIAAPVSGSGKTTVTIGIMECLKRRGLKVAPFKVGPDFIDPGYHRAVTGRPSLNLDGWICQSDVVQDIFAQYSADADIAVIEGVMGLFDGFGGSSDEGSTAQIARLTGSTVFLVIDAKGFARSIAPLVKGFAEFDPGVRIGGVIFNNVSSENHGRILREALESAVPSVQVIGTILRDSRLHIPSRHLGLLTADENELSAEYLDGLAEIIHSSVDLGLLWSIAAVRRQFDVQEQTAPRLPDVKIAVARDRAFCFVYESNLELLRLAGAELLEFSPLDDAAIPTGVKGVYLPGGYPEAHADRLSANVRMKDSIRGAIESGMPVYAECGGFIYLTEGLAVPPAEGGGLKSFVGIFPVKATMLPRRKALGYREVTLTADSILGPRGAAARGHEFHYSEMTAMPGSVERLYRVSKGQNDLGLEGYRYRNCLASYIHLHFGSNPGMAGAFVDKCREYKS